MQNNKNNKELPNTDNNKKLILKVLLKKFLIQSKK
jgi:hypothetical protein